MNRNGNTGLPISTMIVLLSSNTDIAARLLGPGCATKSLALSLKTLVRRLQEKPMEIERNVIIGLLVVIIVLVLAIVGEKLFF